VLSQESYGSMTSTVALFVDAGSMYETDDGACGAGGGGWRRGLAGDSGDDRLAG
jgi:hypothetical protein